MQGTARSALTTRLRRAWAAFNTDEQALAAPAVATTPVQPAPALSPKAMLAHPTSLASTLTRIRTNVDEIGTLVCLGSGKGDDSFSFVEHWPGARVLLIDMDERFRPVWAGLARKLPGLVGEVAALAEHDGEIGMRKTDQTGGIAVEGEIGADDQRVRSVRLDTLIAQHALPPPYFLKFDTHGAELPILAGATETLRQTAVIMMEAYNFKLGFTGGRNLTFDEMSLHLKQQGFRCADLCDPLWRPGDGVLWQLHLFFLRSEHPTFASSSYRAPGRTGQPPAV
ncbi:MAG TPA: FkbM family methyltransferase [Geminicoccus sp.]|jgi:FkbM family methyltransferase|uniref:FkbM family methyltransferase n=1 Tax=Geminicoccus sp. TaxID=2024832 RepID=UPI002E36B81C|nr:FkbM family methyltransferase [Geminicoccus sp.]HEX2525366.1 FkbM family methyltransferase [Geminicoccus sp.]